MVRKVGCLPEEEEEEHAEEEEEEAEVDQISVKGSAMCSVKHRAEGWGALRAGPRACREAGRAGVCDRGGRAGS